MPGVFNFAEKGAVVSVLILNNTKVKNYIGLENLCIIAMTKKQEQVNVGSGRAIDLRRVLIRQGGFLLNQIPLSVIMELFFKVRTSILLTLSFFRS